MTASTTTRTPGAFGWRFTLPLSLGSALNPLNSSLIAPPLVPIAAGVHVGTGRTAALVSALYLACTVAQPTAGKAAEVFGPRRVFLTGILLVLVGGLVGGFAPGLKILVVSRVLIGLGTSCAYPTAMLLIRRRAAATSLERPPGGVLGGLQIAGVATASLGLPLGGVLVQLAGWRAVFFVNVPVALVALAVTLAWIPRDAKPPSRRAAEVVSALDLVGILGFAGAMTTLLLFAFSLPTPTWVLLVASAVLWAFLLVWERRVRTPFLDVRLLASNAALSRTYLRFGLVFLCSYLLLYGVTQWVQVARGFSALAAGLLLLPMTVVSGVFVPAIARRNLVRGPLVWTALGCLGAGVVGLFLSSPAWVVLIVAVTVLLGFANGAASSNQLALYSQVEPDQLGTASGLMRSAGYVGSIASSAVTAYVFRVHVTDAGVTTIAAVMIGAGLVLLLLTAFDRALPRTATT